MSELDVDYGAAELLLAGLLNDGTALAGSDTICIVGPGDVNGDGLVGGQDLSTVLSNWGKSGMASNQGDLSGDGLVSGVDYAEILANWGQSSPAFAISYYLFLPLPR